MSLLKSTFSRLKPPSARQERGAKSVDSLSVIGTAVVATGWSLSGPPKVSYRGETVADQVVQTGVRPDLTTLKAAVAADAGFKVVALLPWAAAENDKVELVFPDGERLRRTTSRASVGLSQTHNRFIAEVNAQERASLLEIGSRARSGITRRDFFPTLGRYTGLDVAAGPNVDVVADAHTMSETLPTAYFDFAYSISVFEHLLMPWVAAVELNRVLVGGGMAFIQSHAAWPLHEEPWDFLRFSKDAWTGLFNPLTGFEMIEAGYDLEAAIVPLEADAGPLQGIETHPTYLLSGCLVRKVGEPEVDWRVDPSRVYDLAYNHV